jgi:hypothetical protein
MRWLRFAFCVAAMSLVATGEALADAIDGDWCAADGRHMSIRGPDIVTPTGATLQGQYSRHAFIYQTPAADPSPGLTIYMRLVNPDTVDLWAGAQPVGPAEVWSRCTPISALPVPPAAGRARPSGRFTLFG